MLQFIIEYSLRHRFIIVLSVILLVFLGISAIMTLPSEFLPDLGSPIISVMTEKPGLATVEVENLISRPIENRLQNLPNLENIRSESANGLSIVIVTFRWGTDYYLARQLIIQNLSDIIPNLPIGTNPPYLTDASSRMGEVIKYYIRSDSLSLMDLRELADYDIRLQLLGVPGVARINNLGGEIRQFQVLVDMDKLRYYSIGLNEVTGALKANNITFSGGVISEGPIEYSIRGLGRLYTIKDLNQVVVSTRQGVPIYLKNIAILQEGPQFRRGIVYVNGKEAVSATVVKQYGSDTQPVINRLLKAINDLKQFLPRSVDLHPFYNQAELITVSIRNLQEALFIGGLAVLLVVILFLTNLHTALIIAVSLPVSVIITFIFMKIFNITINVMSLGGLAVGLGIMIDAAIVDTENIFRWIRLHPHDAFFATLRGAIEVRRPVAYSTAIIIAVFVPLMFLTGFEGKLFTPFSFTIVISMLIGFVLSLTLTPILCYTLLGRKQIINRFSSDSWLSKHFVVIYEIFLKQTLKRPLFSILLVVIIFLLSLGLVPFIDTELLPPFDENAMILLIWMPAGTGLDEASRVSNKILSVAQQAPDVKEIVAVVGRAEGGGETEGMIGFSENYIELVERNKRTRSISEIEQWIRERTSGFPGAIVTFETPLNDRINESISGTMGQLAVNIFGADYDILAQKANHIKQIMESIPGVTDLVLEQTSGLPLITILIDRSQAGRYGLTPETIGDIVETALEGKTATTVTRNVKEFKVIVRLQERFRDNPKKIGAILIDTPMGAKIKLSEIAHIWQDSGPMMIKRENLERRIQLSCNIYKENINTIVSKIKARIPELNLPQGYTVSFGGNYQRQQELHGQIFRMVLISLLIIFMLLIAAFNSVWQALLIIFTIPLALMGGVWSLFFLFGTFNVSSLIGFVAHFGLTVQKGVILVEYINDLLREGMSLSEALITAGKTRMRPVVMTALCASLGVLPLALGVGAGVEIQQPMAIVLIGGLVVSTPIILLILPVVYGQVYKTSKKSNS